MSRIYFDMNVYNRPFDDQEQVKIRLETIAIFSILQKIKNGELILLWSFMIDFENTLNPYEDIRQEIEMTSSLAKEIITPDDFIFSSAKEFEAKGIKPRDALHIACAIKGGAKYFLTCDDKLIKKASGLGINLKITNPISFVAGIEEV